MENSNGKFVFSRRELKREARANFKHHYLMFVVACLFALIIQAEFLASDNLISVRKQVIDDSIRAAYEFTHYDFIDDEYENSIQDFEKAYREIDGDADSLYVAVQQTIYSKSFENEKTNKIFGRTRGILNQAINFVIDDSIVSNIYSVIVQFAGSDSVAQVIVTALITLIAAFVWLYFRNVYVAVSRRIFLEGRVYKKIPFSKYLFFIRMKRWTRASLVMGLKTFFELLGMSTVIGFPVVHCGLILVPYIIAENPDIKPVQALKLSWRMMNGNKMKVFKLFLSFLGWYVLGFFTLGVSNVLYANPYIVSCYSEFYAKVRQYSKEKKIAGTELLNDEYLFVRADSNTLTETYSDVITELEKPEYSIEGLGTKTKFIAKYFGVVPWYSKSENEYEEQQSRKMTMQALESEAKGYSYPTRLSPIPEQMKIPSLANIHYLRHYSVCSLVLLFFIFANFGWAWELFYYFLMKGKLINRGVLHGPWLPIYGVGGLFILILLNVFRKRPFIHTMMTVVLCGSVEYFSGWALEKLFNAKWWDYSGYFLNLNGRICAEGLFVFAIAGIAFIYVLAPLLDNYIRRIKKPVILPLAIALLAILACDCIFSSVVPNTGYGITGNFDDDDSVEVETVIEETE